MSERLKNPLRAWRLGRAERALNDYAWRVEEWGLPGVYPSEKGAARARMSRLVRRVHRLGGDPRDAFRYRRAQHYITEALPDSFELVDGFAKPVVSGRKRTTLPARRPA